MATFSLRKKSGRYYARAYDRSRSPKRKERALGTSRKDVARRCLTQIEEDHHTGQRDFWEDNGQPEHLSVKEAMDRFLDAKSHLRPASLDNYEVMIGVWGRDHAPPGCRLRSVQPKHLKTYIHASDVEQATRCTRYRHLRAFLNWTVEEGYLNRSPLEDVRQPKKEKKQPAFFSADDIEKIMLAIDAHAEIQADERGPTPNDQWLKDLIRVAVATGLRRSELLNLRFEDIDFQHGILHVRNRDGERTKSGHERSVKLVGGALQVLRRCYAEWGEEGGRVFVDVNGTPIKPDRATKRFKFFVRKAKLPNRERLNFHSLRHTTGSWLAMQGVPMAVIRDILGHSSTQITEIYSHATSAAAARAMEETFGGL